jgi:hypothetical protein
MKPGLGLEGHRVAAAAGHSPPMSVPAPVVPVPVPVFELGPPFARPPTMDPSVNEGFRREEEEETFPRVNPLPPCLLSRFRSLSSEGRMAPTLASSCEGTLLFWSLGCQCEFSFRTVPADFRCPDSRPNSGRMEACIYSNAGRNGRRFFFYLLDFQERRGKKDGKRNAHRRGCLFFFSLGFCRIKCKHKNGKKNIST